MLFIALLLPTAVAVPVAAPMGGMPLLTASGKWMAVNDPVMGGISTSGYKTGANGVGIWSGEVKVVPKLHAPGFCRVNGVLPKAVDVSSHDGLTFVCSGTGAPVRTMMAQIETAHSDFQGQFVANMTIGTSKSSVFVPFSSFRPFGIRPEAGGPPSKKDLAHVFQVGYLADGTAGKFEIDITSVIAGSTGPTPGPATGKITLSTFDGNKATTQPWRATNDPVMGGLSDSFVKITNGVLSWNGQVRVVPKLHAPGFCTATTGGYHQQPDKFPDISAAEGLLVTARNKLASGLSSFKVSMQTSVNSGERYGGFEGYFNTTVTQEFKTYFVPFSAMAPMGEGGKPEGAAPSKRQLAAITGLGFNQDGTAGKFELEVKEIAAGSPGGGGGGGGGKTLDLVTFQEGDKTNFKWTDLNDPVMGGRSTSTFKVEGGKGVFDGVCRIVPQLKAPGFCNAEARPSLGQKVPDASAFIEGGMEIELVSTGNLTQFKAAFGNKAEHDFGSYKADFVVTAGANTVRIPFTSFSNKWSSSTGEPTVKCTPENKRVCPTAHSLATIGAVGVWAEGYAGQFHLELTAIRAYSS